jgi:Restriction endonuclease
LSISARSFSPIWAIETLKLQGAAKTAASTATVISVREPSAFGPPFRPKRWTDNSVGRPDIDRFRGAIQGEYDHGVFLTTSGFSKDAKEASYRKGAITILLLDGPAIADLLVERGLGVRKLPLFLFDIDEEFFDLEDE